MAWLVYVMMYLCYFMIRLDVEWCGIVFYCIVWCGVCVSCMYNMVWYGMVWYDMVWHSMVY